MTFSPTEYFLSLNYSSKGDKTSALLNVSFIKPLVSVFFLISIPSDEASMTLSTDCFGNRACVHGKHSLTCLQGSSYSSGHERHTDECRSLPGFRELTTQQKR